jgi:methylmalonyl-CoA/ethylmalonyl-CoA epimerase
MDRNAFASFDTEAARTTTFETYIIPEDFVWPEPDEWFPAPPPAGEAPVC